MTKERALYVRGVVPNEQARLGGSHWWEYWK